MGREQDPAYRKWQQKMRTDPKARRMKIEHWKWQAEYGLARGWGVPEHVPTALEFYERVDKEYWSEQARLDPAGWQARKEEIDAAAEGAMRKYREKQAVVDAQMDAKVRSLREKVPEGINGSPGRPISTGRGSGPVRVEGVTDVSVQAQGGDIAAMIGCPAF
jgi:hypothetical protein